MPTVLRTARPVSRLTIAVVIVTPADGPSLGPAPAGTWMWNALSTALSSMPSSAACERTNDSAICADSFITSPSWPVRMRPLPCPSLATEVASPKRTSPPALLPDLDRRRQHPSRDLGRNLARDLPELALQVPHAGLSGVVGDDAHHRFVGHRHLVVLQPGLLDLSLEQVVLRDRDLLLLCVTVEPDQLHAVQQGRRDRLRHVGGRDEQHL